MIIKPINYGWKYLNDFREEFIVPDFDDSDFITVNIPHTNHELYFNNFDENDFQFESCYRKKFKASRLLNDEACFIQFEGIMAYSRVYLNGKIIGEHKSGYTPFRVDISDLIEDENCIVVHVDSRERADMAPFGFVIDYLTYGGIYREVQIERGNRVHVDRVAIKPKDVLGVPFLEIDLGFSIENQKVDVFLRLDNGEEKKLELTTSKSNRIKWNLENLELWSLDNPKLYEITIEIIRNNKLIDSKIERFGVREAVFKEDGFYLNGKKVKLMGLNRHQSFPYVGYAMPKRAQVKDADILKYELGVNIVRTSHYPQSKHFLERCDEIGLLVFEEIPGWQHIGDEKWKIETLKDVRRMIERDINHPSIVIWGTRINESRDDDEFYTRTYSLAKEIDETRQIGGVRCIKKSNLIEDVYTYNDFVFTGKNKPLEKKRSVTKSRKPYLITEFNGHMFPTKKYDDEAKRTEHAIRHLKVLDKMMGEREISGAIGWCMFDYNTHKDFGTGDRICYHGVMDMFRIPKPAAYAYASQSEDHTVMSISSSLNMGEYASSLLKDIYVFTNCDFVEMYKDGKLINRFYPDKDNYPNLKHSPIMINDFVGDEIKKNENFSNKDAEILKKVFIKISQNGYDIKLIDKMKMLYILFKYKMNQLDAEELYIKYFGGWGSESSNYEFKGIKDKKVVKVLKKGKYHNPQLDFSLDDSKLVINHTYDVTRAVVRLVDEYGNDIVYANDAFVIEIDGPLEVIGPKTLSLIGGSIGFWIKTTGSAGTATITLVSERFGNIEKKVSIEDLRGKIEY